MQLFDGTASWYIPSVPRFGCKFFIHEHLSRNPLCKWDIWLFRGDVWQHVTILPTYSFIASNGNRTRAARVAGEHSTTEPPMLTIYFFTPFDLEIEGIHCFTNRACSGVVGDVSVKTILHSARLGLSYIAGISNYDLPFDWSSGPHILVGRNSSVGRALDWRSKGPWFNPGFRH